MLILIGESASGKSTIEKELVDLGYIKIVSYTSRPIRNGEVDGIDYHYITDEKFIELDKQGFFAEKTIYNNWHYGTAIDDCTDNKVIVVNPHGFRQLKKISTLNIKSFYIKVSQHERLIRIAKRGDDIMEIFRRVISDQGVFQNVDEEVDFVIENYNINKAVYEIVKYINQSVIKREMNE